MKSIAVHRVLASALTALVCCATSNDEAPEDLPAMKASAASEVVEPPELGAGLESIETGALGCMPTCDDLECGPDPTCGRSCGSCGVNERCSSGKCRTTPTVLVPPGQPCGDEGDCGERTCKRVRDGNPRCYGNLGPNDACMDDSECREGLCAPTNLDGTEKVCVEGLFKCVERGVGGTCYEDLAIAFCQYNKRCNVTLPFDTCVQFACDTWPERTSDCDSNLDLARDEELPCAVSP